MKIEQLRVNDQCDPIGIELDALTFSWLVTDSAGVRQTSSRLEIAWDRDFSALIYDSGDGECLPSYAFTPDIAGRLTGGRPYYWRVSVKDDAGESAVSDVASFEGGRDGHFRGEWITPSFTHEIHPVMRRRFSCEASELKAPARLYICGLGLYEAYLNGERIGEQYLTPYFTDYRYRVQYQTYDISGLLREGENTLDIWLGEGWYKGRFGYIAGGQLREYYGDEFRLIADLTIGSRVIPTDEGWQAIRSPVLSSGIYDGECFDSRRLSVLSDTSERELSSVRTLHESKPPRLTPMIGMPVARREELNVSEIITTPAGETVLDFGQEITGWVEFSVSESVAKDTRIILQHGEVLQDGNFYNANLRTAQAQFTYIADGTRRLARPHFTFFGFRYVKVTGLAVDENNKGDFHAVALYSDIEEIGHLETGSALIDRLILNTKWGQKGNFLDVPTDCPQRDERCGWTGDAEIFSGAASYHMRTGTFFRKYMLDMADEQREKGGAVPYVVPDVLTVGRGKLAEPPHDISVDEWGEAGSCVWGDAATIIPWNMYLHTGNLVRLSEQYDNMKQWADFMIRMDEQYCGGQRLWTCGFHFGDWLSLDVEQSENDMDNREGGTDKYYIASMFYMYSTGLTAKAAKLLGNSADAEYYSGRSDEVRQAIRKKYLDDSATGKLTIDTQTAYATAIRLGLFDEPERSAAGDRLVELVHKWKDHLATGFVGTAYLCDALTETGHADLAYTLLFNEDYPSWLYEVKLGATTIWERWNSLLPDGRISGTGMNSLNHYAYGVIVEWIYSSVCGLRLDETRPAGRHIVCAPHPDGRLGHAGARVRFAAGEASSAWKLEGESITYELTVPFDTTMTFIPDRKLKDIELNGEKVDASRFDEELSAGTYTIRAKIV